MSNSVLIDPLKDIRIDAEQTNVTIRTDNDSVDFYPGKIEIIISFDEDKENYSRIIINNASSVKVLRDEDERFVY